MSRQRGVGLAIFPVLSSHGGTTNSAHARTIDYATEWSGGSVTNLGALPGSAGSIAAWALTSLRLALQELTRRRM